MFNAYDWKVKAKILDELDQIWGYDDGDSLFTTQDRSIKVPEPSITFADSSSKQILAIKSSGIVYNRDAFPNDSSKQAAERVYACIKPFSKQINQPELNWQLDAWNEYPKRMFKASKDGIEHNFDLDLWHWWMMDHLEKLVKNMPS